MEELLRQLLNQLEQIGDQHEELYDSDCRERMSDAVMDGFVRDTKDFLLTDDFGLYSPTANRAVKDALRHYIESARLKATELGLAAFRDRLAAFQNPTVESDERNFYDDFFGHSDPEAFDTAGNVIDQQ
jgi:hypothetical protein